MQGRRESSVSAANRAAWIALACLVTACGGEDIAAPPADSSEAYDPCVESQTLETLMIADFEAAPLVAFFTSNDNTASYIAPETTGTMPVPLEDPKCPADSSAGSAYHVLGRGFQDYGLSFGFNGLGVLPGGGGLSYFDAESWTGVSMWVRKGSAEGISSFFAAVADRFTEPSGGSLFLAAEQDLLLDPAHCATASVATCYCTFNAVDVDGNGAADPLLSQCDKFGAGVGIDLDWRFFKIPFARMRQRAYGRPSVLPEAERRILGLDFGLDGTNLDFWIDDVAFYRERATE